MISLLCGTLVRDPHKMRRPMNSETSFIASAPSKGSATKTADARNAQARRKQESRNSEVCRSQRTTCSGRWVGNPSLSSYQVTNPLSTRRKLNRQLRQCQLFFLTNHRIFELPQAAKRAVDRFVHQDASFLTNITRRKTCGIFLCSARSNCQFTIVNLQLRNLNLFGPLAPTCVLRNGLRWAGSWLEAQTLFNRQS